MEDLPRAPESAPAPFWRRLEDGRAQCGICPRRCRLRPGQRGYCRIRGNQDGAVTLLAYGRTTGVQVDPIEKKPLYHFLPGTAVLSFGTVGCNLGCRFCQNWNLSRGRDPESALARAAPATLARLARERNCRSVAFTYNDPVVFHEYAVDTAQACHALGVATVAVSAGYQCPEPREAFYRHMDAANIDLKGFTDSFYRRLCGARLQPVLETLQYIRRHTRTWLEVTTLLIPGENDSPAELDALTAWVAGELGPDVPLHFSAFHPDWLMQDIPPTPPATLREARRIARGNGLRHVYLGNVRDPEGSSTWCPGCGGLLIERDGYRLGEWRLTAQGACARCGAPCPGVFRRPESPGRSPLQDPGGISPCPGGTGTGSTGHPG